MAIWDNLQCQNIGLPLGHITYTNISDILERNQAIQHTKAEGCAEKGEIQKFHLHSSSSNEEFLAQDPICN